MKYLSSTIALIVERLNRQYFLPAIQREFVWKPEQVIQLFDSLLRGYPISSFLFWELTDENRNKWPAYQFIEAASQGTHNQRANTDGIQQMTLVLDGQQRLTSLLVGLKGTYAIKKKYKHKLSPDSWTTKRLFLDLFQESRSKEAGVDENETDIYYDLEFHENQPPADVEHYWFKVGGILNFPDADKFYDFKFEEKERFPGETTKKQIANFEKNLQKLYDVVWKDDVIAYYTEHEQEYDRVLDIFVRANMGGTKLSKSELLLSMITAVWDGINAREAIHNFVDSLNNDLPRKNNLSKDFVMKACLALTDLSVRYKADNFSNEHLGIIKDNWEGIKKSIVRGVELGNRYGLDRDTLTSANALIPVIYFLHDRPSINLASGSKPFEVRNREIIRRWLISVMINRIFSGSSDNLLTAIRGVLKQQSSDADFPVKEIGAVAG